MNLNWWTDFGYLQRDKSLKFHFAKKVVFVPIPTISVLHAIQEQEPQKAGESKIMERKEFLPFTINSRNFGAKSACRALKQGKINGMTMYVSS